MHFREKTFDGYHEHLTIEIYLGKFLEDLTYESVLIKSNLFEYELKATENLKSMQGLMLLEYILFATEKFMEENMQASYQLF